MMLLSQPKRQDFMSLQQLNIELIEAVIDNDADRVNELLHEGADPNCTLDKALLTPLHFAAQNNALFVIPLLVEAGADLHAKTQPEGSTPIDIAFLHAHEKIVQTLLAYERETDSRIQ